MATRQKPLRKKSNEQKRISMGLPPRNIQKILIVSEGKIEESYFKKINSLSSRKIVEIKPICSILGTNALNVVNSTIEEKKKCLADGDDLKSTWSVFDVDKGNNTPDSFRKAILNAKKNKINICISNPCFEVWLINHYSDSTSPIENGDKAKRKIKENISNYDSCENFFQNNPNAFDELMRKRIDAIENSDKQDKFHDQEIPEIYDDKGFLVEYNLNRNPSTHVYKLIKEIFEILNKEIK